MMALIELYAHRLRPELASMELKKIRSADVDRIHFAWMGDKEPGKPHYYRIHGPSFLIEYDNTQNNANHIHTVWRDPMGDFGDKDPLAAHYQNADHHHPHVYVAGRFAGVSARELRGELHFFLLRGARRVSGCQR